MSSNIRVVCRFRPSNQKEIELGGISIVTVDESGAGLTIKGAESNHNFGFDRVFVNATQKEVYDYAARPVAEDILRGYNGTIFVYGQTSSGKTHTMQGPNIEDPELKGFIPRLNETIFQSIANADPNIEFLVKASYIEIYMERIRDLLDPAKNNLKVREEKNKGIWVDGATEVYVSSEADVIEVIQAGTANRAIAATKMNFESSRSHSIFILTVNQKNLNDMSNKTGKLYLVDLAGSEKVEKTGAEGTTLDEAKMINKSLSSLGNVINALTDGKAMHIPYRDSKLTRVLQESLGGNSRTTLVINCSPSSYNEAETLSTLRFGNRAKSIKNAAKINAERSVAELKILLAKSEKEIERLTSKMKILEDEIVIFQQGGVGTLNIKQANGESTDAAASAAASAAANAAVVRLQEKCLELENTVQKMQEERQQLVDVHESFVEELKEKEQDLEMVETMKEEIMTLRSTEQTLFKENELLIVKLADITISNEKMQYDNEEQQLQIENLSQQNSGLSQELVNLKIQVDTLTTEKNNSITASENEGEKLLEGGEPVVSGETADRIRDAKAEHELLTALRVQMENQKNQIDSLTKDKEQQDLQLKRMKAEYDMQMQQRAEGIPVTPTVMEEKPENKLEMELQSVREQTSQKILEFDALKTALLRDLENRCQKVIELQILLDDAREQYKTLLVQMKNSNSKALQQKCIFLQRNLEQLTAVQQQLSVDNSRLKMENQVCVKQLAVRNDRIQTLESLLQDAQEKLQRHAMGNDPEGASKPSSFKRVGVASSVARKPGAPAPTSVLSQHGGRIAKPIRGGGGKSTTDEEGKEPSSTMPTLSPSSEGRSFWSIFRSNKKPDEPATSSSSPTQQK